MKGLYLFLSALLVTSMAFGQATGDYQSVGGPWNQAASWLRYDGASFVAAPSPPSNTDGVITIFAGTAITVTSAVSADQIVVQGDATLAITSTGTLTVIDAPGVGDDLFIQAATTGIDPDTEEEINIPAGLCVVQASGIIRNQGVINTNTSNSNLVISGRYQHNQNAGSVPLAVWNTGSSTEITGALSSGTIAWNNQNFYDFIWNPSSQSTARTLVTGANPGFTSVHNLDIRNTNATTSGGFALSLTTITNLACIVQGDLLISGNSRFYVSTTANTTITVQGNLTISATHSGTALRVINTTSTTSKVTVNQNLSFTSGSSSIDLIDGGTGKGTLDLKGNLTLNAGTIKASGASVSGGELSFTRTSPVTPQNITITSGGFTGNVNFIIGANSKTNLLAEAAFTGTGSLTLNGKLGLGSTDPNGALQIPAAGAGNIRVGTRTYVSNSTIIYNSTLGNPAGVQYIGDGFPSAGDVNLEIDNIAGVNLSDNLEIVALKTLTLTTGNIIIGSKTLTINGTITGTGGVVGGPTSNVVIGGSGDFGTLTFNGTTDLLNFTINRGSSGEIVLGGDLRILGVFTHTAGKLNFNGRTLRLSGDYARTSGSFVTNDASTFIVDGSGTITGGFSITGSVGTFTLDNTNGVTLTSISVSTRLNLLSGTLTGNVDLPVQTPTDVIETVERGEGALLGTLTTSAYHLVYSSASASIVTGPELADSGGALRNFTVNGTGTITLDEVLDVNGVFTKSGSGTFNSGGFGISLAGNYSKTGGTTTYTGTTFTFDGNTTLSGTVNFVNALIASGSTLNLGLSPTTVSFSGNIDHDNGGTLTAGTGTTTFTGSTILLFNGSNTPNFNNINIAPSSTLTFNCGTCGLTGDDLSLDPVRISGNWNSDNTGAVFNQSTARVQLIGNNQTISTLATHTFYTLEFNGTGSVTLDQPLTITNDLIIATSATLNVGGGSNDLHIGDDFIVNGSFVANQGTVFMNGSTNQGLNRTSGSAATVDLFNLTIDKVNNTFNVESTVPGTVFRVLNELTFLQNGGAVAPTNFDADFDGPLNAGTLVLVSSASRTARITAVPSSLDITGNLVVERYIQNNDVVRAYRYFASPVVTNASLPSAFGTVADWQNEIAITGQMSNPSTGPGIISANPSMYLYNEATSGVFATGWEAYPNNVANASNTFVLEHGRGYGVYMRNTGNPVINTRGVPFIGSKSYVLSFNASTPTPIPNDDGWHLIGNPYASPIDWDLVRQGGLPAGITDAIYLKNNVSNDGGPGQGQYVSYVNGASNGTFNGIIASTQAFWVQTTAAATLMINEDDKTNDLNPTVIRSAEKPNLLKLIVQGNGLKDVAVVYFDEMATDHFDSKYDARKPENDFVNLYTFEGVSNNKNNYSINALPSVDCSKEISIGLTKGVATSGVLGAGSYQFTFDNLSSFESGYDFKLVDTFKGTSFSVVEGSGYAFEITSDAASLGETRFKLQISKSPVKTSLLLAGNQTCDAASTALTIASSEVGVSYTPYFNNQPVGGAVAGTGEALTIPVTGLTAGAHSVAVKATGSCSSLFLDNTAVITYSPLRTAASGGDVANCGTGSVTLKVSGAAAGETYRWYDVPEGGTKVAESPVGILITPDLMNSKTYYASVVNSMGCEGVRVAVKAIINAFDPVIISESGDKLVSSYPQGNQWFYNGTKIEGATGQSITPDKMGTYATEVTVGSCTTRSERTYLITGGIEEEQIEMINIFPNPVQRKVTIRVRAQSKVPLTIYSMTGVEIEKMELKEKRGNYYTGEWDAEKAGAGTYIIRVQADGKMYDKKIIKEK